MITQEILHPGASPARAPPGSTPTAVMVTHLQPNALSRVGCVHLPEGRSPRPSPGVPSARDERPLTRPPNSSGDNWHLAACSPFLHLPSPPSTEAPGPSVTGSSTNILAGYRGSESSQAQQKRHHQNLCFSRLAQMRQGRGFWGQGMG